MNNIKQALESAIKAIESDYELNSAKWKLKAALAELDKCEPQQQWVGLSAEKRSEILDEFSLDSEWNRSKAIEAELKQLNTKG